MGLERLLAICKRMLPHDRQAIEVLSPMAGLAAIDADWILEMWRTYPWLWTQYEVPPPRETEIDQAIEDTHLALLR